MAFKKPTVKSVKNQYKVSGDFHRAIPGTPIYNEKKKLVGVTKPRELTHIHSYGKEAPFFESLPKGKLLATRCDNAGCEAEGSIFIPFRCACPDCLGDLTTLDITKLAQETATVHSFMVTERTGAFNSLKTPIKFINIEFDGVCTILMSYLSLGDPEIGMKVVPIFRKKNPTFSITDLSWVPAGTPASKLPAGFSF